MPTVAMLAFLAITSAYPDAVTTLLRGKFDRLPVGLFLCAVAGFEFHVLYATEKMLRSGTRPSALRGYGYAFVETSLPTLVIVYYATIVGPVQALLMPTAFVYFVFILFSTLRLDFALSAFTGLVAASEYAARRAALERRRWRRRRRRVDPMLSSLPHHLGKAFILFVAGISAGFVARRLRKSFTRAIESLEERSRILGVFGQHVSPEVVDQLVQGDAQVAGELREVCVMFLDIRDFTASPRSGAPRTSSPISTPSSAKRSTPWCSAAASSTSSWATASWPSSARRSPTETRARPPSRRGSTSSTASIGSRARDASRRRASASACTRGRPSSATSDRRTARSTPSSATS